MLMLLLMLLLARAQTPRTKAFLKVPQWKTFKNAHKRRNASGLRVLLCARLCRRLRGPGTEDDVQKHVSLRRCKPFRLVV
jgi:hypothetical protein